MIRYTIIFLFLITTYAAVGQTDIEKQHLKGSILSLKQSVFIAADSAGNLVKEKAISKAKYTFNKKGFLIASIVENPDKYQWDLPEKSLTTYKYDVNYKIMESITVEGKEALQKKYFYTSLGKCIKTKTYNQKTKSIIDKSEFKYNAKNQLIAEQNIHYSVIRNLLIEYDATNNIAAETCQVNSKGEKKTTSYSYKYNQNNLEIESVYKNEDQEISIVTTKYDENNNPILKISDGSICNYKYTLDTQNNWIKCIQTIDDNKYIITEREITYY